MRKKKEVNPALQKCYKNNTLKVFVGINGIGVN